MVQIRAPRTTLLDVSADRLLMKQAYFDRSNRRFEAKHIYTNVADVLVSINPYTDIPGLYDIPMPVSSRRLPFIRASEGAG